MSKKAERGTFQPVIQPTSRRERESGAGKVFIGFRVSLSFERAREILNSLISKIRK